MSQTHRFVPPLLTLFLAIGAFSTAALADRPPPPPPPPTVNARIEAIQADLDAVLKIMGSLKGKPSLVMEARRRVERALAELEPLKVVAPVRVDPPPPPPKPLAITNVISNLCLGVRGVDQHAPGAEVEVYHCAPGGIDRGLDNQWRIEEAPDGFALIHNRLSNLCLGVRGADQHGPGTGVEVGACVANGPERLLDNQWRIVAGKRGHKQIQNRISGLCLAVAGNDDHAPGTGVEVAPCDGPKGHRGGDSRWHVQDFDTLPAPVVKIVQVVPEVKVVPVVLPMADADFRRALQTIDSQSFGSEKLRIIDLALAGKPLTVAQVKEVIAKFSFSGEQLDVVRKLNPGILDRDNRYTLFESFVFDSDKKQLEDILRQ